MAEGQEIEVNLAETPELPLTVPEAGKTAADSATEQTVKTAAEPAPDDAAISELKRQYEELKKQDESRAKAVEAAQRTAAQAQIDAQRATAEAQQAKSQVVSSELQATIDKFNASKSEADAAEREHTAAMEAGNWAEAAKAQRRLSHAEANQVALERDKKWLESQDAARTTEGRVESTSSIQHADPFEAAISRLSPKAKGWLREHPDCVTDDEQRAKAQAADFAARKKGLAPDSDEYFKFAEEYLGYTQTQSQTQQNGQTRQRTMPAAPPSREPSSSPAAQSTKVRLTPGEVDRATDGSLVWNVGPNKGKPIGVNEMARRKALLEKEGAYTRRLPQ